MPDTQQLMRVVENSCKEKLICKLNKLICELICELAKHDGAFLQREADLRAEQGNPKYKISPAKTKA